ncbi:MAG TPA: SMP-30/gluconolactonase/LRE family protein [Flavisolibacter sp.]|nr:SMP-30/gluconolactonase/LRE family protein [Flavisolibacter sp.]
MRQQLCLIAFFFINPIFQSAFIKNCMDKKDSYVANNYKRFFSDTDILAKGAEPKLISRQFSFTEGPATDKQGNIFFTDQPNNKIWKYDIDGKLTLFLDNAGRSNGMYFDSRGNLISCADEKNQLWSISKDKKVKVLVKDLNGKNLNGPNDVWVSPSGDMYITDPYYQRPYWKRTQPDIEKQNVYLLPHGKTKLITVIDNMQQPNGIVGTPDGKLLYVADIQGNKTYRYKINKDGSLSEPHLFTNLGSDGMTLDDRGNVYLTGNGVTVFNTSGEKIKHISIPENWTANVAFGGKNKNVLFITASEAIYTVKMKVKGVE